MLGTLLSTLSGFSVFALAALFAALVIFTIERLSDRAPDPEERKKELELQRFRAPYTLASVRRFSLLTGTMVAMAFFLIWDNTIMAILVFVIGVIIPLVYPWRVKRTYMREFEQGFTECLDIWTRCLQAGLSLQQAIDTASKDMAGPVGNEMAILHKEISLGDIDGSLWHFYDRVPLPDVRYAVIGVVTCRQTGGRISEVVGNIADAIRERMSQRERINAITSMGRTEAYIMAVMPLGIGVMMYWLDPETVGLLFSNILGIVGTLAAIVWECIGLLIIWKIVNVEA